MEENTTKLQQVIELVQELPVVRPKDLKDRGPPNDYLSALAQKGVIERVVRELYQWPDKGLGRHQSQAEVGKKVSQGGCPTVGAQFSQDNH